MARRPRHRQVCAGLAAVVLGTLLGVAVSVGRAAPAAVAGAPAADPAASSSCLKKNGSPVRPRKCASATPTPDPTGVTPTPQVTPTAVDPTPGADGDRGTTGGFGATGGPVGAVGSADVAAPGGIRAAGIPAGSGMAAPTWTEAAAGPAGSLPLWPILWTGTAVITLVSAGMLLMLRDRRRPPPDTAGPVDDRPEPDQPPRAGGPIRMAWIEPAETEPTE